MVIVLFANVTFFIMALYIFKEYWRTQRWRHNHKDCVWLVWSMVFVLKWYVHFPGASLRRKLILSAFWALPAFICPFNEDIMEVSSLITTLIARNSDCRSRELQCRSKDWTSPESKALLPERKKCISTCFFSCCKWYSLIKEWKTKST